MNMILIELYYLLYCLFIYSIASFSKHFHNSYQKLPVFQTKSSSIISNLESQLLELLASPELSQTGRGVRSSQVLKDQIENIVKDLELSCDKTSFNPIGNQNIDGCWKLLYTSNPGTNSPIQRTFTGIDGLSVFQVINLINTNTSFLGNSIPDVSNTICFGDAIRLRVTALASTNEKKLIEPRKGDGKILGLNVFGVSSNQPPRNINERIDFAFQEAKFEFRDFNFEIPYPVPFKLLGDEAKGWIDITYLSSKLRVSRGNKGTMFILQKLSREDICDSKASFAMQRIAFSKSKTFQTKNQKSKASIIILPSQLGVADDYNELKETLTRFSQDKLTSRIFVTPLQRFDWIQGLLPSFISMDYLQGTLKPQTTLSFYFKKIDLAIEQALVNDPDTKLILLGHSIGGWIMRAYLSEWASNDIRQRVVKLVSLGSPHNPPPSDSSMSKIDQTRGLLSYINTNYPGAHEKSVEYVSIIGNGVVGGITPQFDRLLAYASYLALSGSGDEIGDGIIPISAARLPGAKEIILQNIQHSNFFPTPGKSARLPLLWYGSDVAVEQWFDILDI